MLSNRLLLALLLLLSASALRAQVVFTITAEARAKPSPAESPLPNWDKTYGYIEGQSYTFVFTTGTGFANNSSSSFNDSGGWVEYSLAWVATLAGEGKIWATLAGTGLSGSYTAPAGDDENSRLSYGKHMTFDRNILTLAAGTDDGTLGLTTPDNTAIAGLRVELTNQVASFPAMSYLASYQDPVTYFSTRVGTYTGPWTFETAGGAPLDNTVGIYLKPEDFTAKYELAVTSLTISAIPEPSTYALLAGCVALGLGFWRKRRCAV